MWLAVPQQIRNSIRKYPELSQFLEQITDAAFIVFWTFGSRTCSKHIIEIYIYIYVWYGKHLLLYTASRHRATFVFACWISFQYSFYFHPFHFLWENMSPSILCSPASCWLCLSVDCCWVLLKTAVFLLVGMLLIRRKQNRTFGGCKTKTTSGKMLQISAELRQSEGSVIIQHRFVNLQVTAFTLHTVICSIAIIQIQSAVWKCFWVHSKHQDKAKDYDLMRHSEIRCLISGSFSGQFRKQSYRNYLSQGPLTQRMEFC